MTGDNFSFIIDEDSGTIVFDGGFSVPIVEMLDEDGFEVDSLDEADTIAAVFPPEGRLMIFSLEDLSEEQIVRRCDD